MDSALELSHVGLSVEVLVSLSPVLDLDTSRNSVFLGDNLGTLCGQLCTVGLPRLGFMVLYSEKAACRTFSYSNFLF
jgi:hypothetical protein